MKISVVISRLKNYTYKNFAAKKITKIKTMLYGISICIKLYSKILIFS